jgi:hypothetical protein
MINSDPNFLWAAHLQQPFPSGARGAEVQGIDLVLLDSLLAGCVTSLLDPTGPLDYAKAALLADLRQQLRDIAPQLEGETGRHFARLGEVADATLAAARRVDRI